LRDCGFIDDVRSDSTCTITNGNPGVISACGTLALTAADNGKLVRIVWPASGGGSSLLPGQSCILDGAAGTIGKLVGGVCTTANYTGGTQTNAFVQVGTDALSALNTFTTYLGDATTVTPMQGYLPKAKMMISDTWDNQRRAGAVHGYAQFSGDNINKPTTQIIWDGPRGHPIIKVRGTQSFVLSDLDLVKNTNPLAKPSACIDSLQDSEVTAFNDFDRINCNPGQDGDPDAGQIGGDKISGHELKGATYCFEFDPDSTGQNDRSYVKLMNCGQNDVGFYFGQTQIDTDVIDTPSILNSDIAISSPVGGAWIAYGVNDLTNSLFLDVGGGGRYELYDPEFQSSLADSYSYPFGMRFIWWGQGGSQVTIHGQQAFLASGSSSPATGVAIDVPGVDLRPVYPGNSTVVAQNTLIQPPPQYPDWNKNKRAGIYVPEIWYASSPYANHTIILPVNNNAGGFYYRVTTPVSATKGPGITGLAEPTWNQTVEGTTTDSQAGKGGITWTNIGTFQPNYVIVPKVNNAGGYAHLLTTAGTTGAVPPAWNQSVGGTTTDNTAVWTNIGVLGTNPGLFVLKATTGGTTGATPPAAFSQVYNGTTTDGTVVWTTTFAGADQGNTPSLDTNNGIASGGTSSGDPTTLYEAYANVNPNGAGSVPHFFFNCSGKCQGWNQAGTLRFVSNKDQSGSANRVRTFTFNRSGFGSGNAGESNSQTITAAAGTFQSHLNQLAGSASVAGGPLSVAQLTTPSTPSMTCIVPVFLANGVIPANYVIKPAVAQNAGSYFFQNQGAACVSGATEPAPWNQTPAGTQADGTCTWTNINTAPLTYYTKITMRDGNQTPNLVGETLPSTESAGLACGPANSQAGVAIQAAVQPQVGVSRLGVYMSTGAGTETLVQIARTDNDQIGTNGAGFTAQVPISQIPPPAWAATTTRNNNDIIKPTAGLNAGGYYFVVNTAVSCTGAAAEPTWTQTIGNTTTDGECSWTNIGLGTVPAVNTTARMTGPSTLGYNGFVFANIAAFLTTNGQTGYCSDCTIANPCAGVGTGAIAKRLNGINVCN